jgi:type IX secretion system PorP/SprF family membrane protein
MRALLFILTMGVSIGLFGQDALFSQYWLTPASINPAATAGHNSDYRATLQRKNQGTLPQVKFNTSQLVGEMKLLNSGNRHMGVGLLIRQDRTGEAQLAVFEAGGMLAYHIRTGKKNRLSAGFGASYRQRSIDLEGLSWDSQYNGAGFDPTLPTGETFGANTSWSIDLQTGLQWLHDGKHRYTIGYSTYHYAQDQGLLGASTDKTLLRHQFIGSYSKKMKPVDVTGDLLVAQHGGATTAIGGVRAEYKLGTDSRYTTASTSSFVSAGVHYRWADAILFMVGYDYHKTMKITFGYDITTGSINVLNTGRGGWELGLVWSSPIKNERIRLK